jgi:hypothetical protein
MDILPVKKFPAFMEPETLSHFSQNPIIKTYPETDQSSS